MIHVLYMYILLEFVGGVHDYCCCCWYCFVDCVVFVVLWCINICLLLHVKFVVHLQHLTLLHRTKRLKNDKFLLVLTHNLVSSAFYTVKTSYMYWGCNACDNVGLRKLFKKSGYSGLIEPKNIGPSSWRRGRGISEIDVSYKRSREDSSPMSFGTCCILCAKSALA